MGKREFVAMRATLDGNRRQCGDPGQNARIVRVDQADAVSYQYLEAARPQKRPAHCVILSHTGEKGPAVPEFDQLLEEVTGDPAPPSGRGN
jgi:hypothetical protein